LGEEILSPLAEENNLIVEQMATLMREIRKNRESQTGSAFYEALDEFQYKSLFEPEKPKNAVLFKDKDGKVHRAESKTKRLICMKQNRHQHKK